MELSKVYYSIGELAEMFGVTNSLLRYWETEFDTIKPAKNKRGDRRYTEKDIQAVAAVYDLVKRKGYTIAGARKELEGRLGSASLKNNHSIVVKLQEIRSRLKDIEKQL